MRVLVIGSGGREHALVWKLAQSPQITQMWCAPGNAGIAEERLASNGTAVENVPIGAEDLERLVAFAAEKKIEFTVVGPDNPLALGIVDLFQAKGLRVWGPTRAAARFEWSKAFSQQFMERHGIPTARSGAFSDAAQARKFAESLDGQCAVKVDGLALGKGVVVCRSVDEAHRAIDDILVKNTFGAAGDQVVIQEYLHGTEVSLHALCDGQTARLFPTSQDHKAALDDDRGPNTGGMGTYSPTPFLDPAALAEADRRVVQCWLAGCRAEKIDFRGMLYPGLMLTAEGPKVLEFNARFGDPETQVYVTRLATDLLELLVASAEGTLRRLEPVWSDCASVCVVMASRGYPGPYAKGVSIHGLDAVKELADVKVFHAGTVSKGGQVLTAGGRVLGVTAWARTLREAQAKAYAAVGQIEFDGAQFRHDIAAKALRIAIDQPQL